MLLASNFQSMMVFTTVSVRGLLVLDVVPGQNSTASTKSSANALIR
jgi:hypothetical protein